MAVPELIYCADGNARYAEIAINAGFLYGAQVPNTVYFDPYFVDQDWKNPDLDRYAEAVKNHRPFMASVLDWESQPQLPEVLRWAETIAPVVEVIMIIPKVVGGIDQIPEQIAGKSVRLGYSVPTKFGGTGVPIWEFKRRPTHLLGGSPQKQRELTYYLNVISVDGNMHLKMANQFNAFFDPQRRTPRGYWPTIEEYDGAKWGDGSDTADAPYEAFRRSCEAIWAMWHGLPQRRYFAHTRPMFAEVRR